MDRPFVLPSIGSVTPAELREAQARQDATGKKGVFIKTFGCQMNEHDSEVILGMLQREGYEPVDSLLAAKLILFNTCAVRENPERKLYGQVNMLRSLKEHNPDVILGICGCMTQQSSELQRIEETLDHVDLVFGTHNIHELPYLIAKVKDTNKKLYKVWDDAGPIIEPLPAKRQPGLSAFVNIMYGCNNFCSYCIVPYTRGRERSRSPEFIIEEIQNVAAQGYKEVTLLGQNVNSYGKGLEKPLDFADLLKLVTDNSEGIERIRFMTSHPKDISDNLIETIAQGGKICEHVHVALQSGSNNILKLMNRKYTKEHYIELTKKMRDKIPNVAITTDIIVGFPGETEEDFAQTLDVVDKVQFDAAYTFMYSPRSGTRAAEFADHIPLEIKKARLAKLMEVQYEIAAQTNQRLEGTTQEVLVEGPSKTNRDLLTSRTRTNRIVIFSGQNSLIGKLINVRIKEGKTFSLTGEYV